MADLPAVYIETSFLSYLAARPSRNVIVAGHQALSHEWWDMQRHDYTVCVSDFVIEEAAQGDPEMAQVRLELAAELPLLEIDEETLRLTRRIIEDGIIPGKAKTDAAHVAVATRHAATYLLTWNCRHIANAVIRRRLASLVLGEGYELPIICTPIELLGRDYSF